MERLARCFGFCRIYLEFIADSSLPGLLGEERQDHKEGLGRDSPKSFLS